MLHTISNKGGRIKPTHLMYKANLSHKLMSSYLDYLMENKMVGEVMEGKNKYFTITDKGHQFLEKYRKMEEFKEAFGLSEF